MRIIRGIVVIAITLIGLGFILPYLWPLVEDTLDLMEGMSGGDSVTILQAIWPILLIVVAISAGVGIVYWALKELGVVGGKKHE